MAVHKRAADRCTREKVGSPGRPSAWQREERGRFWQAIALGRSSEEAALDAEASAPLGPRWFREAGGMPPTHMAPCAKPRKAVIFPFLNARILQYSLPKVPASEPLLVSSGAHQAQSHGRSAAMPLPEAVGWITDQARRNGMLTAPPVEREQANWRAIRCSANMLRSVLLVKFRMEMAWLSTVLQLYGRSGVRFIVRVAGGQQPGANRAPPQD
jgi:hypothetical protein